MTGTIDIGWLETDRAAVRSYLHRRLVETGSSPAEAVAAAPAVAVLPDVAAASGTAVPIHLTGAAAVLGPTGGGRPCARCLALRWGRIRGIAERRLLRVGRPMLSAAMSPYLHPLALEAVWQLWSALPAGDGAVPPADGIGRVHVLDLRTLRSRAVELVEDSECPRCAPRSADTAERATLALRSRRKPGPDVHRVRPLRQHAMPTRALVNPVCGMLGTGCVADQASSTTSPSVGAFSHDSGAGPEEILWTGQTTSFGSSETAGLLEGLERYASLEQRRLTAVVVDSLDNLRPHALDPRSCGVYPDATYEALPGFEPFAADRPIPWVWGWSVRDERPVLVPQRLAYFGARRQDDGFVHECSSGCAGGSNVEEAVLHGLLELVERDGFVLAWYARRALPEIDIRTCPDERVRHIAGRIGLLGYDVRLFDARADLPIPVVVAVAVRRDGGTGALCFAGGAALVPDDAVWSALSEVASYVQSRRLSGLRDRARAQEMSRDYTRVTDLVDHALLFTLPEMARHADFLLGRPDPRPMDELYAGWQRQRPHTLDLLDDLRHCVGLLAGAGFDVLAVDQTAPEQERLGLRSVRVVVPGLLPLDFGWLKQRALHLPRTRTAPRTAGWSRTDLAGSDLNRVPHPFS